MNELGISFTNMTSKGRNYTCSLFSFFSLMDSVAAERGLVEKCVQNVRIISGEIQKLLDAKVV